MSINWGVRLRNPIWWGQLTLAIATPIFTYYGINFKEVTTWRALGDLCIQAVQNPFVVTSIVLSVLNVVNDPTTKGLSDSQQAMNYYWPN